MKKYKSLSITSADAAADIDIINQFSKKKLMPNEVFCFSLILCDNDIDRDMERFTDATLEALAPLFVGKTGISDHEWSFDKQFARIYRCGVERLAERNSLGERLCILRANAYMLNTKENKPLIDAINGGIAKEISIGCAIHKRTCSICQEAVPYGRSCPNGHVAGETYQGQTCVTNLEDPTDAYEFSFVAVPAQRGAGVTKSVKNPEAAFDLLMTADLGGCGDKIKALILRLNTALMDEEEHRKRADIIRENEEFLKKGDR